MMPSHITLSVDISVGAAYIQLSDLPVVETVEATPDIQVDIDATGAVVGVEVLDLAAELPVESLVRNFRFTEPDQALLLSQVRKTIQAFMDSSGAGQAFIPTLQAV